jgi:hypothetical protein
VVVAAPEEKRASLMECVDSIVTVARMPSTSYVLIDTANIGHRAKQAMAHENPIHKGIEAFRDSQQESLLPAAQ